MGINYNSKQVPDIKTHFLQRIRGLGAFCSIIGEIHPHLQGLNLPSQKFKCFQSAKRAALDAPY